MPARPVSNTTEQVTTFAGLEPNTGYIVYFHAYHYEDDPTPYTLGVWARSNSVGIVRAYALMEDLAQGYQGLPEAPVYEVQACISDLAGVEIACGLAVYVGYYPESMWWYDGRP